MAHIVSNDYENILLNSSGLLDVRAPIEFDQGAFPQAANLPLLNNYERQQIGIHYRDNGQQQAIELGHNLVQGDTKNQRIQQWINFAKQHDDPYLYCLRGGLRSKITQQWLHEAGINMPRVQGGYKALRQFLVQQLKHVNHQFDFILLGGMTGCRKTQLIQQLKHGIDLEAAANHRGSSFGAHATAQSSQINFENLIAINFMRACKQGYNTIALEDESRFIGSVDIPKNIFHKMRCSPLVVVENNFEQRTQQLLKEYVIDMEQEFIAAQSDHEIAFENFSKYLLDSLSRIRKRLGSQRWQMLEKSMRDALIKHKEHRQLQQHLNWISPLLQNYYDPMYTSQLAKRSNSITFRGSYNACYEYLNQYQSSAL